MSLLQEASPPLSGVSPSPVPLYSQSTITSFLAFITHGPAMFCCQTCPSHDIETSPGWCQYCVCIPIPTRASFFWGGVVVVRRGHCHGCNWGNRKHWWNALFPNHCDSNAFKRFTRKTTLGSQGSCPPGKLCIWAHPGMMVVVGEKCPSQFGLL